MCQDKSSQWLRHVTASRHGAVRHVHAGGESMDGPATARMLDPALFQVSLAVPYDEGLHPSIPGQK